MIKEYKREYFDSKMHKFEYFTLLYTSIIKYLDHSVPLL